VNEKTVHGFIEFYRLELINRIPKKLPKGTAPSTATKKQVASHGTTRRLSSFSPSGANLYQ
jgi:hypothetical protein